MSENIYHSSAELLDSLKFCVIDLETTGGNPEYEKIIEIGMVKIENRRITEERSFLINPQKDIPDFVQKLTGIKMSDVQHSPTIEEVIDEIIQFIGNTILVAHNTSFDIPFLNGVLKKLHRPTLDNKVICTNIMTKYLIPDIMSSNLQYMSDLFQIPHSQAHRAIEDAKATGRLLLKYLDIFEDKKIRKVNQLYYPRNKFELDRIIIEKEQGLEDTLKLLAPLERPVTVSVKGDNGVILAILPVRCPRNEIPAIEDFLKDFRWNQILIKLSGPFFEGLFQMNANFVKIPETYRKKTINYLKAAYTVPEAPGLLDEHDFIITPHLITGQFIAYSFLNFSPFSQLVFKFPSHKKKLHQFLLGQIGRFETQQKGKRKAFLQNDLKEILLGLMNYSLKQNPQLHLCLKSHDIKNTDKNYIEELEKISKSSPDAYQFPFKHL